MATKNEILTSAEKNLDALGDALGKKIGTTINLGGEVDAGKLEAVKKSFTTSGTLDTIPEDVYKKIAATLNDNSKIKSIFEKYSTQEAECIKQVAAQVAALLKKIKSQTFPVGDETYTIEYFGAGAGVSGSGIRVSNGTDYSFLNFKNDKTAKDAMAQYCVALYDLGKKEMTQVLKECAKVFMNGGKDLLKAIFSDAPTASSKKFSPR